MRQTKTAYGNLAANPNPRACRHAQAPQKTAPPPPGSTRTGLRGICHPWHGITRVVAKLKTLRPTNYCGIYNLTEEHV